MKIGFTGTREGLTESQCKTLKAYLSKHRVTEFHHGSAAGADEDAVVILMDLVCFANKKGVMIHARPCNIAMSGSANAYVLSHEKYPEKDPLERNKDIVQATELLIATPKGPEEKRSGTWSTVRAARRLKRHIVIIWPNGITTEENAP